jgi:hypothetical protein
MKLMPSNFLKLLYLISGLIAFGYVAIRASLLNFTYDEIWTVTDFVPLGLMDILNCSPCDANNHIVNTYLIKLFYLIKNNSVFLARVPNLMALGFFIFFSYKTSKSFFSPIIGLSFFVILLFNPFILDFFGLARGYGIALAFMMASIYFLFQYFSFQKSKYAFISLGLSAFSVICNYPFLNYFLGVLFIINFYYFFSIFKSKAFLKFSAFSLAITAVLGLIIYEPIRKLIKGKGLYYGGASDFYHDTLGTLTTHTLYNPYDFENAFVILNIFLVIFLVIASLNFNIKNFSLKSLTQNRKGLFTILLLIPILSNITQFYLLNTLYLIDRTALLYYPLIMLVLAVWADDVVYRKFKPVTIFITGCIAIFSFINFSSNASLLKTVTWEHDSRTSEILAWLNRKGEEENRVIKFDSSWPFQMGVRYYMDKFGFRNIEYVKKERQVVDSEAEFYIYYNKSLPKVSYNLNEQKINLSSKDTILKYDKEAILLFSNIILE